MTEYEYSPFGFVNSHERAQTWFPCKDKHTYLIDSIAALKSKHVYYVSKLKELEELLNKTGYPKTRLLEMKEHTAKKIEAINAAIMKSPTITPQSPAKSPQASIMKNAYNVPQSPAKPPQASSEAIMPNANNVSPQPPAKPPKRPRLSQNNSRQSVLNDNVP